MTADWIAALNQILNSPPEPPAGGGARPSTLVESFEGYAREKGWDTHAGSSGKCWFIAHAFAQHASALGHRAELWSLTNPRSTRPQDNQQNVAVIDGWVVDFASRAGAGGDTKEWPTVAPVEEFLLDYGERLPLCPTCGQGGDQHLGKPCPGFEPIDRVLDRVRKEAAPALLDALRAGTSLTRAEALEAIQTHHDRRRTRQRPPRLEGDDVAFRNQGNP